MAESKRRDRPKGAELRASLKTKKPVRTPALQELAPRAPRALAGSAAGAAAEATDPFLSRNEFKRGQKNIQVKKKPFRGIF
jgi:hypothetical protein